MPGLRPWFRQVSQSALDLLFPMECVGCGDGGRLFCPDCVAGQARLEPPFCPLCADPGHRKPCRWCIANQPAIDGITAPFLLEGPLRELIHRFKYRHLRAAAPVLGELLAEHLAQHPIPGKTLVPVPLHPRRLRSRGYNQAELLAMELRERTGLPVNQGLLVRQGNSPPQVESTSRRQRAANVAGGFAVSGDAGGLQALLIDDVTTTGNTLFACAATLKEAGAASVWGLALAKEAMRSDPNRRGS